jgi:hypothetical protein
MFDLDALISDRDRQGCAADRAAYFIHFIALVAHKLGIEQYW